MHRLTTILTVASLAIASAKCVAANEQTASSDKLFDPARLIEVVIEVAPKDWDRVRLQSRSLFDALRKEPVESPFRYVKGNVTIDGVTIKNVGIRKKGFLGSLDEKRPSLKIKFNKYVEQSPYGDLDRLTLNNNKQDTSRLSQFLTYKMFNEAGCVAPRCGFAKVTVNGRYLGIYSNVESVKQPMLKRGYGDGSGPLFEGTIADLYEDVLNKFESKTGDADKSQLRALSAILAEGELDLAKLESLLDVEAFIRFWAMESLIGFWDGYTHNQNNFFVYQNPANKKFYFMPWGADSAFTYVIPPVIDRIPNKSFHNQSILANRLYRTPATRKLYRETLDELLATHWNEEALLAEVARVESLLEKHIRAGDSGFHKEVDRLRAFIKGRRKILESELKRWPIPLRKGPRRTAFARQVGGGSAKFKTVWYAASPGKPETLGSAEMVLTLAGKPITFRQIGVTSEPSKDASMAPPGKPKPPTVVFNGLREPDGRRLTLVVGFDSENFRPRKDPAQAFGVLIEGSIFGFLVQTVFNPSAMTFIVAQTTFSEASMKPGEPVVGEMKFKIIKFAGGKSPTVRWEAD